MSRESTAYVVRSAIAVAGVVCLIVGVAIWLRDSPTPPDPGGSPATRTPPTRTSTPDHPTSVAHCRVPVQPFRPSTVAIAGVARSIPVVAVHRDDAGVPGVPPLTDTGKHELAWDAGGIRPGDARGNVLMNAHTWPDGSALGNALLRHLHPGDLIVVRGSGRALQCYRVRQRVVVPFPHTPKRMLTRYYAPTGEPRLALVACSGRRLRGRTWTERTLWFARPVPAAVVSAD